MSLRLGLIVPGSGDPWRLWNLRRAFATVAGKTEAAGWTVTLIAPPGASPQTLPDAAPPDVRRLFTVYDGPPVLTGPGSQSVGASLKAGYQLTQALAGERFDILLGPLTGGLLQPLLMARATGEAFTDTTVALWGEPTTRDRVLAESAPPDGPACLVEDALERGALSLADAVLRPRPRRLERDIGARHVGQAVSPSGDIVFVGPASTRYGLDLFLNAVEALDRAGGLGAATVRLVGPWRADGAGLSKAMLGVRAQGWRFRFEVVDTADPGAALAALARPGAVGAFAGEVVDDAGLAEAAVSAGARVLLSTAHPAAGRLAPNATLFAPTTAGLTAALTGAPGEARAADRSPLPPEDWPAILLSVHAARLARPPEPPGVASVSVCITHRDRPAALARAVASAHAAADPPPEIVVADASVTPQAAALLAGLEADGVRVLRSGHPEPQGMARNRAAGVATGEVLVFLDDDNRLTPGAAARFAAPIAAGRFDIVVTALDLHDADGEPPAARLAFLGDAGTAGLLFNGFGDGNLAISRQALASLGGFSVEDEAAFDWVFLARARTAGLRIGVLQRPAVAYRREVGGEAWRWRKLDGASARARVLAASASQWDGALLARLVQGLAEDAFQ